MSSKLVFPSMLSESTFLDSRSRNEVLSGMLYELFGLEELELGELEEIRLISAISVNFKVILRLLISIQCLRLYGWCHREMLSNV